MGAPLPTTFLAIQFVLLRLDRTFGRGAVFLFPALDSIWLQREPTRK